jgi:hypothetical protein
MSTEQTFEIMSINHQALKNTINGDETIAYA